jgi:hypothetical protein
VGQKHLIEIKFVYRAGDDIYRYPFDAPLITWKTAIWHPNIGKAESGVVCLDMLKDKKLWNPGCTIDSLIIILKVLLNDPNPESPQNSDAGQDFVNMNDKDYRKKCKSYYKDNDPGEQYEICKQYWRNLKKERKEKKKEEKKKEEKENKE